MIKKNNVTVSQNDETDIKEKEAEVIGYEQKQDLLKKEGIELDYHSSIERIDLKVDEIKDLKETQKVSRKEQEISNELRNGENPQYRNYTNRCELENTDDLVYER